ncbi:MAG: hypothetical protein JWP87_4311 [Labilithrix sp.]|nr:hypothetical protein [Labilithrix sp.]
MDVSVLLEPTIDLPRLAEVLDGLGHEGRVHATRTWSKKRQAAIYEACKGQSIDYDFLVPPSMGTLVEVIHDLHNTLPLFSNSQKRFCRLPKGDTEPREEFEIAGYNHASTNGLTGPGYFVVRPGDGEHEGELAIDYTKLPKSKPANWPEIRDNTGGIGALVYGGMIDYMRKVSTHVSIGRATKGKPMDAWFTLVRKDVA